MKSIRSSAQSRLLIFCVLALAVFWLVTSDANTIRQAAAFSAGVFVCCAVGTLAEVLNTVIRNYRLSEFERAAQRSSATGVIFVGFVKNPEDMDRPDDPIGH